MVLSHERVVDGFCLMKRKTVHCIAKEDMSLVPNFLQKGTRRKPCKWKPVRVSVWRQDF
jgi:hypothetical protein